MSLFKDIISFAATIPLGLFLPSLRTIVITSKGASNTDPYWANVVALLHLDGTNGDKTCADQTTNKICYYGLLSNNQSKWGTCSTDNTAVTNYEIRAGVSGSPLAMGTGDFTWECWSYGNPGGDNVYILNSGTFAIGYHTGSTLGVWNVGTPTLLTSGGSIPSAAWHHCALSRSGTNLRLFLDGVQVGGTVTNSTNVLANQGSVGDGFTLNPTGANININDVRITKGVARYTSNFAPPTAAFPNGNGTQKTYYLSRVSSATFQFTVPAGYTSLTAKLWGGASWGNAAGGAIKGVGVSVNTGDIIYGIVGNPTDPNNNQGGQGTALKLVRSGSIIATLLAGGAGDTSGGNGGGGNGSNGSNGDPGMSGGSGATTSAAGSGGGGDNNGTAGTGPYSFASTPLTPVANGGAGGAGDPGAGGDGAGGYGGGGYYGGGGGGGAVQGPGADGGNGGGGSGTSSGGWTVTTYQGVANVGANVSDPDIFLGDGSRWSNTTDVISHPGVAGGIVLVFS